MKYITVDTMTPAQLAQVLLQLKRRIDFLEDVLAHNNLLLLEERGAMAAPDHEHVAWSEAFLEAACRTWSTAHQRSKRIEQELRDERPDEQN